MTVVAFGAHCDDIEIGAGGTLLQLAEAHPGLRVVATVLTSNPKRAAETTAALPDFLPGAELHLTIHDHTDGRLPAVWGEAKNIVETTRRIADELGGADIVLGPSSYDAHQDHRLLATLIPTAFRDHLVLGYEILKWDGDVGRPNAYVEVSEEIAHRKIDLLETHYPSQQGRTWFDEETFLSLMRVRGVESNTRYAEAFTVNKLKMSLISASDA